jgi:hypothetical protein
MRVIALIALLSTWVSAATADAPERLSAAVSAYVKARGELGMPAFRHAMVDLNDDREDDAVVLLTGPSWCGSGGCSMLIFRGDKGKFKLVSSTSVTLEPIRLARERKHGWSTLIVHSRGHGESLMRFDGTRYPANPSRQAIANDKQLRASRILID